MAPRDSGPSGRMSATATTKSRLRLIVIQALVFSLFATLFARLYYLQVVGGEEYHAQAASQSVREVVVQPQRGLIVDDMGRPLVANRTSWVVSVDRAMLDKMSNTQRGKLIERLGAVVGQKPGTIRKRLVTCGESGSVTGTCWNGSPYQPVPVASDVAQGVALRILEQPEDYPSVVAEQQSVRAYPQPYGVNLAHVLGYLSPITGAGVRPGPEARRPLAQRRLLRRPRRRGEAVRRVAARHARLQARGRRLDGPGARQRQRGQGPARRHAGHLDRRQGAGRGRAAARPDDQARPADLRPGHPPELQGRLGRGGGDGRQDRPDRRDGQPADVRPLGLGRRHHQEAARPALLRRGRHPAARPGHAGPVRPRLDLEADHDRRRPQQRLHPADPARLLLGLPGRQPAASRTTSPSPTG